MMKFIAKFGMRYNLMIQVVLLLMLSISTVFAQKIDLKYNLKQGQSYTLNQNSNQLIHQEMGGMVNDMTIQVKGKTLFVVNEVFPTYYNLTVKYENMLFSMKSSMMNVEFDSQNLSETPNPMQQALGAMIGEPFSVKMDRKGKILEVAGFDSIMTKMSSSIQGDKQMAKQVVAGLKDQYGDEAMKSSLSVLTALFPETPVAKGETWTIETKMSTGMKLTSTNTITLNELTNNSWKLSGVSQVASDKDATSQNGGMTQHFDLKGNGTFDLEVNSETGWLISNESKQTIEGIVTIEGGQLPSAMEIPMKIESQSTITNN